MHTATVKRAAPCQTAPVSSAGVVDTPIFEHWGASEEQREFVLKRTAESTPLKRVGTPADVASLALFLADNEAASWLTGQVIALDGGKLLEFSHD